MSEPGHQSLSRWKFRHSVIVWVGILLNLAYCVPLLAAPGWTLDLFGIPQEGTTFWPSAGRRAAHLDFGILYSDVDRS